MKAKLALMLILVAAGILFLPSLINKYQDVEVSHAESNAIVSPSKPEIIEELQVAGEGENAGEVANQILTGYESAREQKITSHANCIIMTDPEKKDGCHRYVNDQGLVPPYINRENSLDNISSNQCRTATIAYYEAVEKDMRQQAMEESIVDQLKAAWQSELIACKQYPAKALALEELRPIIQSIEQTGDIGREDLLVILIDVAAKNESVDAVTRLEYTKNIEAIFADVDEPGIVDAAYCYGNKQKTDALFEILEQINALKSKNAQLWSALQLQRKILVWKNILLKDRAAACENENTQASLNS